MVKEVLSRVVKGLAISLALVIPVAPAVCTEGQSSSDSDADALFAAGDYARAAEGYLHLIEKTGDPDARALSMLRLGDCCYRVGPFGDDSPDVFYARVLDHGYSPYLTEAYWKWRTTTQMYWHGVSNLSEIPIRKYRARRRKVLRVITAHLKAHPGDPAALAQGVFLQRLPDIRRGGPMGSSVLNEMGMLWPLENKE